MCVDAAPLDGRSEEIPAVREAFVGLAVFADASVFGSCNTRLVAQDREARGRGARRREALLRLLVGPVR